jgi:hypothetical protein
MTRKTESAEQRPEDTGRSETDAEREQREAVEQGRGVPGPGEQAPINESPVGKDAAGDPRPSAEQLPLTPKQNLDPA